MKTLKYLVLSILFFSCKTKTVTVEKSIEKEKESITKHFDSLFQQSIKMQNEWQKKQSVLSDNLKLSSIPELDSLGNRKPFHFKHYLDGQLKEEIYLEGGEINKETTSNKAESDEKNIVNKQETTKVDVDVGQNKSDSKSSLNKVKNAKVKGFQFGFYVWIFLIIIVLIVLNWVAKRLKLPDKIKSFLGNKGG